MAAIALRSADLSLSSAIVLSSAGRSCPDVQLGRIVDGLRVVLRSCTDRQGDRARRAEGVLPGHAGVAEADCNGRACVRDESGNEVGHAAIPCVQGMATSQTRLATLSGVAQDFTA